jgi:FkbM family methyltransferase
MARATGLFGPNVLPVGRLRRAGTYAAMRAKLARHGSGPGRDRILGWTVDAANYETLLYLYYEVFVLQDYAFEPGSESPYIIDAGANIGMATLFFKTISPAARIDAFEPSPASFRLLDHNVAVNQLANVRLHNAALAGRAGRVFLLTEHGDETSLTASTVPGRGGSERLEVDAVTLSSHIDEEVDLLKMDVEGSEQEVLEEVAAAGKLGLIREIIVEYHHNIRGGSGRLSRFLALLESHEFEYRLKTASPTLREGNVQDVLIRAYRTARS